MKLGKDCTGLEAKFGKATENLCDVGITCHICDYIFEKGQEIYVHEIESLLETWYTWPVCHKKCRDDLPKPEPTTEVNEKRYDVIDERSDKKWLNKTDDREYYHGHPIWTYDDNFMLEKMWKDGESIEEIVDALTSMLPPGYARSKNAIRLQLKKLGIEKKTGRYWQSGGKFPRWTPPDDAKLEAMWGDWQSVPEIMEALGRSENAIRARVRNKKIDERVGRPLPPTEKQFRSLERFGYDGPKPSTVNEVWKLHEIWFEKPTSPQLESELRALGYDGPIPETNQETVEKIKEMRRANEPITESQTRKIKQICQLIDEEVGELPTNKQEAILLIDRLIKKAEQMGIDVPALKRITSTGKKKKRSTPDYYEEDYDDEG